MKPVRILKGALAALIVSTGLAAAAEYPEKPISMIVTWNAGGSTDVLARLLAEPLGAELGVPVAVTNMPGGGGSLGTRAALDAPLDGYTILATTSGNHILTPLKNDVGYRYDDFEPIGQLVAASLILAVREDSPWLTLEDFIAAARAEPGKYLFGAVPDVAPHLTLRALAESAGLELVHLPQQGGAPGATALLAGDVDLLPANAATVASSLKGGKMRGLAVFSAERDPAFPDIPTAKEQGYEVYGSPFVGLAVAKGVPEDVLATLKTAFDKVAQDPAFGERAIKVASALTYLPAEEFGAVWERDWTTYAPMLQK
ncbi:MAG: tripartite tricarboxylate transporter substrate binding protein [Rhodobacteraceae bacterium]|nr:MAG: tripartite tricarboxylate transporter substrate binding protein [Paracoccaceae bacterium]